MAGFASGLFCQSEIGELKAVEGSKAEGAVH